MESTDAFDCSVTFTLFSELASFTESFIRVDLPKFEKMGPCEGYNFGPPGGTSVVSSEKVGDYQKLLLDGSPRLAAKASKKVIPAYGILGNDDGAG